MRWAPGKAEVWRNLAANQIWELTQGEVQAQPFTSRPVRGDLSNTAVELDKATLVEFWSKQHATMDAMKRERDFAKAVQLVREALAINPAHEDSRYYLANCLAGLGDVPSAIAGLDALAQINPQNHRAFQRKGELLAASASSRSQLAAARQALDAALHLNSEETGTLVLLGQVALAQGDFAAADRNLSHACQANARAANAWFLRGFIAWKRGDKSQASKMLLSARKARGPDFKPTGAVLEGDVRHLLYSESGFLNLFERRWDGSPDPRRAYAELDVYLRGLH